MSCVLIALLLLHLFLIVIASNMNTNINTLIASVDYNVKIRDAAGVNVTSSFTLYSTLLKFIKYCRSKSEVKYSTYAAILQDKLSKLQASCSYIKPRRINNIEDIRLNDVTIERPIGDISIKYSDIFPSNHKIEEVSISTTDYTIEGKGNITSPVFDTILLKSKYVYYTIDEEHIAEVPKTVDDNLTSLGYYVEYLEDDTIYYYNGNNRLSSKCTILEKDELYSILHIRASYYDKEDRHISNEAVVKIKLLPNTEDKQQAVGNTINTEIEYVQTPTPERRYEVLPYSGKTLYIGNLHSIESKSPFLDIVKNKVVLSSSYEYYTHNSSVIAVPKEVITLSEKGYTITSYENGYLELSRITASGNKESYNLYTYNISNSLYINYRVKEDNKEPSNVTSIAYKVDVSSVPTDSIINTIFLGYD